MRLSQSQIDIYHEAPDPEKYAKTCLRARRFIDLCWGLNVVGAENIPSEGAAILAFGHRSRLDPWIIGAFVPRAVSGIGKIELLDWYFFGLGSKYLTNRGVTFVDRENPSVDSVKSAYSKLNAQMLFGMAPEATSKNRGERVGEFKSGAGRIASRVTAEGVECPVIPIAIASDRLNGDEITVVVGEPIHAQIDGAAIWQVKQAARLISDQLGVSLQDLNGRAYDLRRTRNK